MPDAVPGLDAVISKWLTAGVIDLNATREDGTREYTIWMDDPRKSGSLVVHPAGAAQDYEGSQFYVKTEHFRDRDNHDPLGSDLEDVEEFPDALDAWLEQNGDPNAGARTPDPEPEDGELNPDKLALVVGAVERHLGDVVEDPNDTAAIYEEAWTLATDACRELGLDNSYAAKALEEMGISAPELPEISLSEINNVDALVVVVVTDAGEDEVPPNEVKIGDTVALPSHAGPDIRYKVVADAQNKPMKNEETLLNQLVGTLLEDLNPEPTPELRPFSSEDSMTYGGAEDPEGGVPLIGEIDLDGISGEIIVDKNGVGIHAFGPKEEQIFYFFPTPFAQGRGIAAQAIRARPSLDKLKELGFQNYS